MASKSSKLRWAVSILLGTIAVLAFAVLFNNASTQASLDKAIAEAKAAGLVTDHSFYKSTVPDDQNAALYPGLDFTVDLKFTPPKGRYGSWTPKETATLRSDCAAAKSQLQLVAEAVKRPRWAPKRDYTHPSDVYWQSFSSIKSYVKLLTYRALIKWHDGDDQGAQDDIVTAARLSSLVSQDPLVIGKLVGSACLSIVQYTVAQIVVDAKGAPEAVRLQQAVPPNLKPPTTTDLINAQLLESLDAMNLAADHDTLPNQWKEFQVTHNPLHFPARKAVLDRSMLDLMTKTKVAVDHYEQDPEKTYKEILSLQPVIPPPPAGESYIAANELIDDQSWLVSLGKITDLRSRLLSVGTHVLAYQRNHGTLPKSLRDLPKGINISDPITHQDLFYKVTNGKFAVWSTGTDGIDDTHGVISPNNAINDCFFQTLEPKRRILLGG